MAEDGGSSSTCVPKSKGVFASTKRCDCDECSALHSALDSLDSLSFKHPRDEAISTTIDRAYGPLRSAIKHVHHLHRPECWDHGDECRLRGLKDDEKGEWQDISDDSAHDGNSDQTSDAAGEEITLGYATRGRKIGKFMVCDHCHGHGLPCNEAAVCEECVITSTACIHRVCRRSPNSRKNCPDPECRYLHKDYMPTRDDLPTSAYIALPGNLRQYLVDGRVESAGSLPMHWTDEAIERQEHTRQEMNVQVSNGTTSRAKFQGACGSGCRPRLDNETESPEERGSLSADQEHYSGDEGAEEDDDKVGSPNILVCNLCQREVSLYCLTPCNHWLCGRCMVSRRALLCDKSCPSCREVSENAIITTDNVTNYEDFGIGYVPDEKSKIIANIGALFEDCDVHRRFHAGVEEMFKCQGKNCGDGPRSAKNWLAHVGAVHCIHICKECLRQGQPGVYFAFNFWDHEPQEHSHLSMILDPTEVPEAEDAEQNREVRLSESAW